MHPYLDAEHPQRLAHRGSRLLWPENTAIAFQGAADLGYRYVETDVQMTRDRVVVVLHDPTLDRTTNARGRVGDWLWDDLRNVDAGWSFGAAEGFPHRGAGAGIMRLDEAFATWPDLRFNIDLKSPGLEWPVAEAILRAGRADTALVASFSERRVARFRRITGGTVATSAGAAGVARLLAAARTGRTPPRVAAYQIPFETRGLRVDARLVDAAHGAGAAVHVWTVNDPAAMERALDTGVDGIVTDRPDLLNEVLRGR